MTVRLSAHPRPRTTGSDPSAPSRPTAAVGLVAALMALALAGSLAAPVSAGAARPATAAAPAAPVASHAGPASGGAAALAAARRRGARFQLATFNILGSNHTRNSRRWARGTRRAAITARVLKNRGTDVVGLQEVQDDQLRVLRRRLDGWKIWPRQKLRNGHRLQIAWRRARFKHLANGHIKTTFSHQQRPIPWVKLRDRRSGRRFIVVDIHNSPGKQERARDRATRKQIRLVKRLRRSGKPVFIVGDANEHREWFCKMGRRTALRAPQGGNPDARPCRTPRRPRLLIDWIMGAGRFGFTHYSQVRSRPVRRASDHHHVQATVRLGRRR